MIISCDKVRVLIPRTLFLAPGKVNVGNHSTLAGQLPLTPELKLVISAMAGPAVFLFLYVFEIFYQNLSAVSFMSLRSSPTALILR